MPKVVDIKEINNLVLEQINNDILIMKQEFPHKKRKNKHVLKTLIKNELEKLYDNYIIYHFLYFDTVIDEDYNFSISYRHDFLRYYIFNISKDNFETHNLKIYHEVQHDYEIFPQIHSKCTLCGIECSKYKNLLSEKFTSNLGNLSCVEIQIKQIIE